MNRKADVIVTLIAILATVAVVILISLPNVSSEFQFIPLIFLSLCLVYFLIYRPLTSPQRNSFPINDYEQDSLENLVEQVVKKSITAAQKDSKVGQSDEIRAINAYEFFAERYGIGNKSIEVEWTIEADGSALLTRNIDIEAYSVVDTIETYLSIPEKASSGDKRIIDLENIKSKGSNSIKEVVVKGDEERRLVASLCLNNPLVNGNTFGYIMQEKLPPGLYSINLTRSEHKERTDPKFDYVAWSISLPTRKAKLKVYFPENFKPLNPFVQVRHASKTGLPQERTQPEETARRQSQIKTIGPEGGRYSLTLEIDYPIIGFIYMLGWTPPTHEDKD